MYWVGFHFIIVCTTVQWALQQLSTLLLGRKCIEIGCKVVYFASWITATCSPRKIYTAHQLLLAVYNRLLKSNMKCVNTCQQPSQGHLKTNYFVTNCFMIKQWFVSCVSFIHAIEWSSSWAVSSPSGTWKIPAFYRPPHQAHYHVDRSLPLCYSEPDKSSPQPPNLFLQHQY